MGAHVQESLFCNSCPTPVQQMDTHREKAGWISPGTQGYSNADLAVHVVE